MLLIPVFSHDSSVALCTLAPVLPRLSARDDFQGLSDCWPEKDDELQVSCPIRPGHLGPIVCAWFALRKSLGLQTETRFDPWAGAVGGDRTGRARLARIGVSQM